jgi:hypothetical protein
MSTKTPGLQSRSQYHSYWGIYADGTTQLPNQSANPLTSPGEFDKLEEGDIGYSNAVGNEGLYVCTDPGGAGAAPPATWVMLAAGGAVVQTIRDAHQIVVGQDTLAPYADVVGQDADFVDDGSGVQLQAALTAAAALVVGARTGVDVRLRPCAIGPAAALTMDSNIKLLGADRDDCTLTVNAGGVLTLTGGVNNVLEGISFVNQADGTEEGLVSLTSPTLSGAEIRRCRFASDNSAAVNTLAAIFSDAVCNDITIEDNEFELNGILNGAGDRVGIAARLTNIQLTNSGAVRFNDNRILFGAMVEFEVSGAGESPCPIQIARNVHGAAGTAGSSAPIRVAYTAPPPSPGQDVFPGPEILGNSVRMSLGTYVGAPPNAIISVESGSGNARAIRETKVVGNTLVGSPNSESGVRVFNDATAASSFIDGVVISGNNIRTDAANGGVEIRQNNPGFLGVEAVQFVTVTGNTFTGGSTALAISKTAAAGLGVIRKGTFTGNSGDSSGGAGVDSNSADNVDFVVVGNAFDGFGVFDPSGTFEVAHNV